MKKPPPSRIPELMKLKKAKEAELELIVKELRLLIQK